jgi:hypothetical protein
MHLLRETVYQQFIRLSDNLRLIIEVKTSMKFLELSFREEHFYGIPFGPHKMSGRTDDFLSIILSHIRGFVTNTAGFRLDDRIYWTLIQLVTTVRKSLSDTVIFLDWTLSTFDHTSLLHYSVVLRPVKSKSHCDWRSVSQSVSQSWCRAPSGAHDQMFLLVWKLLSCPCGAPSLTRGRVCHLSVIVGRISSLSSVQLFTILLLKPNRMYNI